VRLRRAEARVLGCLLEIVVAPAGGLPPPRQTDAAAAFERILAGLPALHRAGLRGLLWALELGPLLLRPHRRLTRLTGAQRAAYVGRFERGPAGRPAEGLVALVKLAYYGDAGVMASLGYDPQAVVARGRALRTAEGRW
jgi:hypothetical protein